MKKIIVFAVHPDDETLGCGGTLLRHKKEGDEIHWVIATDMKKEGGFAEKDIAEREKEIKEVSRAYDFKSVKRFGFTAAGVHNFSISTLIESVSKVLNDIRPNTLYIPFKGDIHSDHRLFFEAICSATKTFRFPFIKKILMMETISETEFAPSIEEHAFLPNYFVNVTDFLRNKIKIMKIYKSEINKHPFPRSEENIKALATFRGAISGSKYAESFSLLKEIC